MALARAAHDANPGYQVDAAQVPSPAEIVFEDPSLKKGDAILMHGFAWHEARPNYGDTDRCGLYMKFHAKTTVAETHRATIALVYSIAKVAQRRQRRRSSKRGE